MPTFGVTQLCSATGIVVGNYTVDNLNNYKMLLIAKFDTSSEAMYNSIIVPVGLFKLYTTESHACGMDFYNKSGTREYGYANYVNNTTVRLQSNTGGIAVLGIK